MITNSKDLGFCGCCEAVSVSTPIAIQNIAGLKAVSYRIGKYSDFKESLLSKLSKVYLDNGNAIHSNISPLRKLSTREDDDFSIALLDSWAMISDILTFYQEKIANETYLNTATEKLSILELARQIGYELRPGVAAETYLAFMADKAAIEEYPSLLSNTFSGNLHSPTIKVTKGVKVQSIPMQDEEPQIFETIEEIEAKAEWNDIKIRTTRPLIITNQQTNQIYLNGNNLQLKNGDNLLFQNGNTYSLNKIDQLFQNDELKNTRVKLDLVVNFQYSIPQSGIHTMTSPIGNVVRASVNPIVKTFNQLSTRSSSFLTGEIYYQKPVWRPSYQLALNNMSGIQVPDVKAFVFRKKTALFGYNAQRLIKYDGDKKPLPIHQWDEWTLKIDEPEILYLDSEYNDIKVGSYIAILPKKQNNIYKVLETNIVAKTDYGMSQKVTSLKLDRAWIIEKDKPDFSQIRKSIILIQSEPLDFAEERLPEITNAGLSKIDLSKVYLDLKIGQKIIISGESATLKGVPLAELNIIKEIRIIENRYTELTLHRALNNEYIRASITVNANVAHATHGESVTEVLGDGNASKSFQKFILKNNPLTFISSDKPSGIETTLELRVNDVLWKEVSNFYSKGPHEKIYIVRQNEAGQTSIIFGDGKNGSRLPTGQQNVKVKYRIGLGEKGLLQPKQLSTLLQKPLGIKEVVNPIATEGSQDSERIEQARMNANLTMYTLERVVSLQDFEDFTRAFTGIQKAKAVWLWNGRKKVVHITVAGVNRSEIQNDTAVYKNLANALKSNAAMGIDFSIESYTPKIATIKAKIIVHQDYIKTKIVESVHQSLSLKYSFENRQFGENLHLSDVSAFISGIEGVVAVDVDSLYFSSEVQKRNTVLIAKQAEQGSDSAMPAELIILSVGLEDIIAV